MFCTVLFLSVHSFSQTYFFDNYGSEQGLESSKVYSIIQTGDDYVWLGTKAGVSKFNGVSFTNYGINDGMAGGGVRKIFEDKNGLVWFGHEGGGITRFDGKKFDSIYITNKIPDLNISSITGDKSGNLWISTSVDGVYMISNPDGPFKKIQFTHYKGGRLGDRIFSSLVTTDGTLYFVTDIGVREFIPEKNTFQTFIPDGLDTYFAISLIFEDSKKNLWFGTYNGGLYKLDHETDKFTFIDIKDGLATNWISDITEDRNGNIWTGHWDQFDDGGISKIDQNGNITVFNTSNGLHDNKIWCVTEDKEGNILIGTTEHGFEIFKGERFISYTTANGLLNNQVYAIVEDTDHQFWIGTNGGISVLDPADWSFTNYNQSTSHISNQIRFLKRDQAGDIWIGSADQGLIRYVSRKKSFEYMIDINSRIEWGKIKEIYAFEIDQNNNIWIGTDVRLWFYDAKNYFIDDISQEDGLPGNNITALLIDSKNTLWVGMKDKGVAEKTENGFRTFSSVSDITPTCIIEDNEGKIWIGTESSGIMVLSDTTLMAKYTIKDGLLTNMIKFLNVDEEDNIYVGTNIGLNKINSKENKIYIYTKKSGFTGIESRNNATYRDSDGKLWFGTGNGVMRLDPKMDKISGVEPLTHINRFMVNGVEQPMVKRLNLSHNEKSVTFYYYSICLSDPEAVRYRIKLDGWETGWNDMGMQNSQSYSLPPGRYTFNVLARNNEGIWNRKPVTYSFRILPPFYLRGWFLTTVILILTSLIFSYIKIRERSLIKEKKVLEEKVSERTDELKKANDQLALRNKDITDSIRYAKRIQFAILPPEIPFEDTFILFKPKDIVSGDFYWMTSYKEKDFIAAVDCTGHGVPGAFMSFIGHTSLNKIVFEHLIFEPAQILNQLNEEVALNLHQKGEDIVNDGMDIALVCYDPSAHVLDYAGAFNPLWLFRNNELIEYKANRFAIGRSTGKEKEFTNHRFNIEKNDIIYLFSDGYSDQFGGADGKKFKTGKLKELLISILSKPMDEQCKILENTFESWRGDMEQIDDVLIIGRKFS